MKNNDTGIKPFPFAKSKNGVEGEVIDDAVVASSSPLYEYDIFANRIVSDDEDSNESDYYLDPSEIETGFGSSGSSGSSMNSNRNLDDRYIIDEDCLVPISYKSDSSSNDGEDEDDSTLDSPSPPTLPLDNATNNSNKNDSTYDNDSLEDVYKDDDSDASSEESYDTGDESSVNSNLSDAAKTIAEKLEFDRVEDKCMEEINKISDDNQVHLSSLLSIKNDVSDDNDDDDDNDTLFFSQCHSEEEHQTSLSSPTANVNLSTENRSLAVKLESDSIADTSIGTSKSNDDQTQVTYESRASRDSGPSMIVTKHIVHKIEEDEYYSEESEMEAGQVPSSFGNRTRGGKHTFDEKEDEKLKFNSSGGKRNSFAPLLCLAFAMVVVIISLSIATVRVAGKQNKKKRKSSIGASLPNSGDENSIMSSVPSMVHSVDPTSKPSKRPTMYPTTFPSTIPSDYPSVQPSTILSSIPSTAPSMLPSGAPSTIPSSKSSTAPSMFPSRAPSKIPSSNPSASPSATPSVNPTFIPSLLPTDVPTSLNSSVPSLLPTSVPTLLSSSVPSNSHSTSPSSVSSVFPTSSPSNTHSIYPTSTATQAPTEAPSVQSTMRPTWFSRVSADNGFPPTNEAKIKSGPLVGHTTHNSAKIWALQGEGKTMTLVYQQYRDTNMRDLGMVFMAPRRENNMSALGEIHGLQASTKYTYQLYVDTQPVAHGEFTTAPTPGHPTKFDYALISCINVGEHKGYPNQPVWDHVYDKRPDFSMLAGDTIYLTGRDWDSQGVIYDRVWARNMDQRDETHFARFISNVPTFSAWDDHEYGSNNAERGQKGKENSLKAWKDLWANPSYGTPEIKGNFYAYYWGNVHFIVMDNRWYRDVGQKTQFGVQQKEWLYRQLEGSQGSFKVIVTGCDIMEAGYDKDTDDIGRFITANKIYGVIFNAGDIHRNEFKVQEKATWPYTVTQFSSSGIARDNWMRPWSIINVNTELADPEITAHFYGADSRDEYTRWSNEPNLRCSEIQGVDRYKESRCTETVRLSDLTPAGMQVSF